MANERFFTDLAVEAEIKRLLDSEYVKLARKENQLKNRRRQMMYKLRCYEKRGKQLAADGITIDDLERMYAVDIDDND